jgi:hypothetical protein
VPTQKIRGEALWIYDPYHVLLLAYLKPLPNIIYYFSKGVVFAARGTIFIYLIVVTIFIFIFGKLEGYQIGLTNAI